MSRVGRLLALGCSVTLLQAQSCGKTYEVAQHFDLPSCPAPAFRPPTLASDPPYTLSHVRVRRGPRCVYKLLENGTETILFGVGLTQGRTCSIDVLYGYLSAGILGPIGGGKPRADLEQRARFWAEAVARLSLQGSGVTPILPAARVERVKSDSQAYAWCARTED